MTALVNYVQAPGLLELAVRLVRLRLVRAHSRTCFRLASGQVGQVVLMFQPVPYGAFVVLKERGFENPCRTPPMEQFVGGFAN